MDKDIARLIELGAVMGEPEIIRSCDGHYGCDFHLYCTDGNGDGGSASALLYWTEECGYLNPVNALIRPCVKA